MVRRIGSVWPRIVRLEPGLAVPTVQGLESCVYLAPSLENSACDMAIPVFKLFPESIKVRTCSDLFLVLREHIAYPCVGAVLPIVATLSCIAVIIC